MGALFDKYIARMDAREVEMRKDHTLPEDATGGKAEALAPAVGSADAALKQAGSAHRRPALNLLNQKLRMACASSSCTSNTV